eukprot:9475783-Alexandrium_andersonii.AAC.1
MRCLRLGVVLPLGVLLLGRCHVASMVALSRFAYLVVRSSLSLLAGPCAAVPMPPRLCGALPCGIRVALACFASCVIGLFPRLLCGGGGGGGVAMMFALPLG